MKGGIESKMIIDKNLVGGLIKLSSRLQELYIEIAESVTTLQIELDSNSGSVGLHEETILQILKSVKEVADRLEISISDSCNYLHELEHYESELLHWAKMELKDNLLLGEENASKH